MEELNHTNGSVRAAASQALGQLGDARAVTPLLERLGDYDNGMRFDTGKRGRNGKRRETLRMVHKRSLLEQRRHE